MLLIDGASAVLTIINVLNTYTVATILEYVFGYVMLVLVLLLVVYDIGVLAFVARLSSQLEKLAGSKFSN